MRFRPSQFINIRAKRRRTQDLKKTLLVNFIKEVSRLGKNRTYIAHGAYGDSTFESVCACSVVFTPSEAYSDDMDVEEMKCTFIC